jgi:small nuclear ribonucleoprotein (snRNP)-like protein
LFRKNLVKQAIRRRFAVTLRANEGVFSGVLTEFDNDVYVFEQCQTVITKEGETVVPIKGRVFVPRDTVSYLQDLA